MQQTQQRRLGQSFECGLHELRDKLKEVTPLKLANPGHGEDSFRELFAFIELVSEAELPPLDCGAKSLFSSIIGGSHPIMGDKRKQVIPVIEGAFGSSAFLCDRAGSVLEAVPFHSSSHKSRGIQGDSSPLQEALA